MAGIMNRKRSLLFLTALGAPLVSGTMFSDPSQLTKSSYDFIIVGGGTAGNVIANRLTENPDFSVLVVEAGMDNTDFLDDSVPFMCTAISPDSMVTWNYTTTPQTGLDNRIIQYQRGYALGGTSTINYMVWTRGPIDDYNRWADYTGDIGWSWGEMMPYFNKSEGYVAPADHHDTFAQVYPPVHGSDGPINVSLPGYPIAIDQRVINTTMYELADEFPYNIDYSTGYPLGVGWMQVSVTTDGRRSSSATAYLEPVMGRDNLDVLILTQVTQLKSTGTVNGNPSFTEVEMAVANTSSRFTVTANNEVILSAGAIGTPQVLMLSGIGDPEALQALNITLTVNNSAVGQNLVDHPILTNHWLVNSTNTFDSIHRNSTLEQMWFDEWQNNGTGLFVDNGANQVAWERISDELIASNGFTDPSSGPVAPHLEWFPVNGWISYDAPYPDTGYYLTVATAVVTPQAKGSVTLASNDPFDYPLIDPNIFGEEFDVFAMVENVKSVQRFLNASAWSDWIIEPTSDLANATANNTYEDYVREYSSAIFHPCGTARMANESDPTGVVTPDLLVKGASNLRVVDASIFPYIPAAHPEAYIYAVAERAADLIKATWA